MEANNHDLQSVLERGTRPGTTIWIKVQGVQEVTLGFGENKTLK